MKLTGLDDAGRPPGCDADGVPSIYLTGDTTSSVTVDTGSASVARARRSPDMNPTDIIANAIRVADGNHTFGAGQVADAAAVALIDERIIANAVQALKDDGWEDHDEPLTVLDLIRLAEVVLRSVGGA